MLLHKRYIRTAFRVSKREIEKEADTCRSLSSFPAHNYDVNAADIARFREYLERSGGFSTFWKILLVLGVRHCGRSEVLNVIEG